MPSRQGVTVTPNVIVVRRGMSPDRLERLAGPFIDAGADLIVQGRKARARKLLAGLAKARPPALFSRHEDVYTLTYINQDRVTQGHAVAWSAPGR